MQRIDRFKGQKIIIADKISLKILNINTDTKEVELGIIAPEYIEIHKSERYHEISLKRIEKKVNSLETRISNMENEKAESDKTLILVRAKKIMFSKNSCNVSNGFSLNTVGKASVKQVQREQGVREVNND
jgi:sRNA-binding carbon storage regulator CsrA